ncbi:Ankyrin repeat-containing protein ITN1 [Camellia lanceoleosa]|uniref:Ankyrin repeat-containing protein ITN1 n=1 Tax=Camellia lanceoleosa TaxID=1840588 RepID=A0ACC0G4C8_9ERIC|nr:Ankyrin repeat-containing protein ITN1 [Camellia lanceoleosa]
MAKTNYKRFYGKIDFDLNRTPDESNCKQQKQLYRAIQKGDLGSVRRFCHSDSEIARRDITEISVTALMIAVKTEQRIEFIQELLGFIQELLGSNPEMALAWQNKEGNTVLHEAAIVGHVEAAKLLVPKYKKLLDIANYDECLPLHSAAACGQREILSYLLSIYKLHMLKDYEHHMLVSLAIDARFFDVAIHLLRQQWATCRPMTTVSHLEKIAEMPSAFPSGTNRNIWQRCIYNWVPFDIEIFHDNRVGRENSEESSQRPTIYCQFFSEVWHKLHAIDPWKLLEIIVPHVKHVRDTKLMHYGALHLFEYLFQELGKSSQPPKTLERPFLLGAKHGITEIVKRILVAFPRVIDCRDEEEHSALHLAVLCRHDNVFDIILQQTGVAFPDVVAYVDKECCSALHLAVMYRNEKVFNMIVQRRGVSKQLLSKWNCKGNNILHMAGQMPYQPQLEVASGAVLQMQRDLQWYKEVEKLLLEHARIAMNNDRKTPAMVFEEEHRRMIQSEEQWIVGMATTCIVATTIIGTIAFAAAIQVPGGNNGEGRPIFYEETTFKIFSASNAIALYSAISTFLIFLSIFTSRYASIDFLYAIPNRLIIGLIFLFFSVTSMIVAFGSALYLMFSEENQYVILTPVITLSCVPVILFSFLQLPLLLNMMKTTYCRSMFSPLDKKER